MRPRASLSNTSKVKPSNRPIAFPFELAAVTSAGLFSPVAFGFAGGLAAGSGFGSGAFSSAGTGEAEATALAAAGSPRGPDSSLLGPGVSPLEAADGEPASSFNGIGGFTIANPRLGAPLPAGFAAAAADSARGPVFAAAAAAGARFGRAFDFGAGLLDLFGTITTCALAGAFSPNPTTKNVINPHPQTALSNRLSLLETGTNPNLSPT
jgi:hypothetical protein